MAWSESQPDFPDVTGWKYFGGPNDGELVELEPGWPAPSEMGHEHWPNGHYVMHREAKRYEWVARPMP